MNYNLIYDAIYSCPDCKTISQAEGRYWTCLKTEFGPGLAMATLGHEEETFNLAAANSFWNRAGAHCIPDGEYYTDGINFKGKTVGVVGHLGGIMKHHGSEVEKIYCFDLDPSYGDLPPESEDELLPLCDIAVITGSSIQNGTLPHLLELCENAYVILTGPSVPQCPALLDFGVNRIAGLCLTDADGIFRHTENNLPGNPYVFGKQFVIDHN